MIHTISRLRVRYAETDRMDVVHHSNYLVWFESARIEMLDVIGIPYTEIEAKGFFIPVLGATLEYKRPAKFDDRIDVHLYMRSKPRARFSCEYEVYRDRDLLATGQTLHGFMDKNGKGIRPPEDFVNRVHNAWEETKD